MTYGTYGSSISAYRVWVERDLWERDHMEDLSMDDSIVLKKVN